MKLYWPVTKASPITGNDLKNSRRSGRSIRLTGGRVRVQGRRRPAIPGIDPCQSGTVLAIVLDRKVISAPRINAVIADQG